MFALGHFALGYLTGKSASKLLNIKLNLPLLFVASVIPDVDLILNLVDPTLFMHRGPMHSIITFSVFMAPFLIKYRKQALPYYIALLSHSLLGDLFTGGFEMLWPLSQQWFSVLDVSVMTLTSITVEMLLFTTAIIIMFKTRDLQSLLKPSGHNLILFIAFGATLGPMLDISRSFEGSIPALLIPASIFWVAIFAYSMLIELYATFKKNFPKNASALNT